VLILPTLTLEGELIGRKEKMNLDFLMKRGGEAKGKRGKRGHTK